MFFRANALLLVHIEDVVVHFCNWDMPRMQDAFARVMSVTWELILLNVAVLFLERIVCPLPLFS
jgi:hypothetical protein